MRLARFAAAGLVVGMATGFVIALLRPRPRPDEQGTTTRAASGAARHSIDVTGPVAWGVRPVVDVPATDEKPVVR